MRGCVYTLVTTTLRLIIITLALPGRRIAITSSTTFSSVRVIGACPPPAPPRSVQFACPSYYGFIYFRLGLGFRPVDGRKACVGPGVAAGAYADAID